MKNILIDKLKTKRQFKVPRATQLVLLGLTPGRVQHRAINSSSRPREGAFKGQMRSRLFSWFNELGINQSLGIKDRDDIFKEVRFEKTVFITSLLREPVYYENGKNYSGRNPVPWKNDKLKKMIVETTTILETAPSKALIVPFGDVVTKSLELFLTNPQKNNILWGFPHPSPLNSHAKGKFEERKNEFLRSVKKWRKELS